MSTVIFIHGKMGFVTGNFTPRLAVVERDPYAFYGKYGMAIPTTGYLHDFTDFTEGLYRQVDNPSDVIFSWLVIRHDGRIEHITANPTVHDETSRTVYPVSRKKGDVWVIAGADIDKELIQGFLTVTKDTDKLDKLISENNIGYGPKPTWVTHEEIVATLNRLYPLPGK